MKRFQEEFLTSYCRYLGVVFCLTLFAVNFGMYFMTPSTSSLSAAARNIRRDEYSYSLWLRFSGSAATRIQSSIDIGSSEFGSSRFSAHMTLASGFRSKEETIIAKT